MREESLLEETEPDIVGIRGGAQRFTSHGEVSNVAGIQELGAVGHRVSGHVRQRLPAVRRLCHVQEIRGFETTTPVWKSERRQEYINDVAPTNQAM